MSRSHPEEWRVIFDDHHPGAYNMAVDETLMRCVGQGEAPPTLRFYGWRPAAVSLGYFQDFAKVVNTAACRRLGVEWVRRPTGGRAVLHDQEVTYAFIIREDDPLLPRGVIPSYRTISQGIVEGLSALGVPVTVTEAPEKPKERSAACFDAPSWYELTVNGRKIVGSAQVRRHGAVLQHGSVLLDLDVDKLVAVLTPEGQGERAAAMARYLARRAISLKEALGREISFEEVARALAEGWARALGLRLSEGGLSPREQEMTQILLQRKYATAAWNERREEPEKELTPK